MRKMLLLALTVLIGCATSRGSLYEKTVTAEKKQAEFFTSKEEVPKESATKIGLEVKSEPDEAEVYLDDRFLGRTPLLLSELEKGRYQLALEKRGYYTYVAWIEYAGGYLLYEVELQQVTGFLKLEVYPNEAEVTVGSQTLSADRVQELPIGFYAVRARLFGYEEFAATVEITEKAFTLLPIALEEAEFRVRELRANREAFNPRNAGLLGRAFIRFQASSFGSGTATILDEQSREVFKKQLPRFSTWDQGFAWNGRSSAGAPLPDGLYTIYIEAVPERLGQIQQAEASVRLDSTLVLAYRSLWSGGAGLLYAPSADVLPGGTVQFSTLLLAHAEGSAGQFSFRVPWNLGLRLGIGPRKNLETDFQAGAIIGYSSSQGEDALFVPFFASAALKALLVKPSGAFGLGSSLQAKLAYQSVRTDTLANFTGLSMGLPTLLALGPVSVLLSPELIAAPWPVSYESDAIPGFSPAFWAYGRAGLLLELPPVTVGFSVSARTLPFGQVLGIAAPLQGALEAHWLIPGTQLFLSFALAAEASSLDSFYLMSGAGLSLLN